jgi:lipoprotein-releasing system ATP-binding protein
MSALLEVRDLFKTYGTGEAATRVLRGLSLRLEAGEMAALLGPSGSGKSTLLTILGTLMKPTSGSYVMLGQDMIAADDKALTVSQCPYRLRFPVPQPAARFHCAGKRDLSHRRARRARDACRPHAGPRAIGAHGAGGPDRFPFSQPFRRTKQRVAVARALMNVRNWCWRMSRPATSTAPRPCR